MFLKAWRLMKRGLGDFGAHARVNYLIVGVLAIAIASFSFSISLKQGTSRYITASSFRPGEYLIISSGDSKKPFHLKDLRALEEVFRGRGTVNANTLGTGQARFGPTTVLCGLCASFHPEPDPSEVLISGRWLSQDDEKEGRLVGIANLPLLKALGLDAHSAIGKTVVINGHPILLVGVKDQAPSDKIAFGETKFKVLNIPSSVLRSRILRSDTFNVVWICLTTGQPVGALADEAVKVMRLRHGLKPGIPNDFKVFSSQESRKEIRESTLPLRAVGWLVTSISGLLAVGVGWHLFALLAQQRRREIGIQRALGASRPQVLLEHVVEACTLLGTSILLGVLMSWAATWFVRTHLAGHNTNYSVDWRLFIGTSPQDVLITCSLWAVLGAYMALFPVRKVLKLSPCELLK